MAVAGAAAVCCQLHARSASVPDYGFNAGVWPGELIIISGKFSRSDYSAVMRRNGLGACFGERGGDGGLFGGLSVPGGKQLLGLDLKSGRRRISLSREASGRTTISKAVDFWGTKQRETSDVIIPQAAQSIGECDAKERKYLKEKIFDVEDPRFPALRRSGVCNLNQAWEIVRQDVLYLDWRARHDVYAIKTAHDKVVDVLNPLVREQKSVQTMRRQLAELQNELARVHNQVHVSESRVEHSLQKLSEMEAIISDKSLLKSSLQRKVQAEVTEESYLVVASDNNIAVKDVLSERYQAKGLDVSGPVGDYPVWLKNFWYPVAFSNAIGLDTLVPFESFEEPWVLFRGRDGRAGCVRDECAHRACPLSLGTVHDGRIQCPYHGWEYSISGNCEKMPSTRHLSASIKSLPCIEQDGMVWIWPGDAIPTTTMPSLNPPLKFTIHAELILELPVEHGLLMENLLDLAHAPFTHTSTFVKGWSVPSMVRFKTPAAALRGSWDPYPIDMEFQPPCMVLSTIGLVKPGQLDGSSTVECSKHLHQLHVCMPSTKGKTRLLYRMALNFAQWAKYVPFIHKVWENLASQVLAEDLRIVEGQQDRMSGGANVWRTPVAYDKLGLRYRRWRLAVEAGEAKLPFSSTQ